MINIKNKSECCGCTACEQICPKSAIKMVQDSEGFFYPELETELCIGCNLCNQVCPLKNDISNNEFEQQIYAAIHNDQDVRLKSSSGGIFTALSDSILDAGGVVSGAGFDEEFNVKHMIAKSKAERDNFCGSKYVQSDMNNTIKTIAEALKNKQTVMFTGTPCQNNALINALNKMKISQENLLTCDFICHGTPSPLIWKEYKELLEDKYRGKLTYFTFRSKKEGWVSASISARFTSGDHSKEINKKYSFLKLYSSLFPIRPSCFECPYTSYKRVADITMGDYWNIAKTKSSFNDNKGVSMVMVNTKKGYEWFMNNSNIKYELSNNLNCWQPHLEYPNPIPSKRESFWNDLNKHNFEFVIKKYGSGTVINKVVRVATPILRKIGLYNLAGKLYRTVFGKKREH